MKRVLVIAGPTASGKSGFAVEIAQRIGGEIISGDSIQIYRGMDIGSGKIKAEETGGIIHHLIDIKDIREPYSVRDFQTMARSLIEKIDVPVICGGTGLYLKACLYDYAFPEEPESDHSSQQMFSGFTNEQLYEKLKFLDKASAEKIHPNNRQRLVRALAIIEKTGKTKSEIEASQRHEPLYDCFIAGCTMPREVLYERINRRVEGMFEDGLEQEVKSLLDQGYTFSDPGMKGIGYQEFAPYMEGSCDIETVKEAIQKHSRNYAKRQYTWLNHQMPVHWFNALDRDERNRIKEEILEWREH